MTKKIMFVDDDRALLNTLERNLGLDFELAVAEGGPAALKTISEQGPFSVITVDMRMPGMDGIATIKEARKIAPDSIYLMLTGNQDMTTAMQAVNDGQVFRFLNKPCEMSEIKKAIEAAHHQYELLTAEKELLHETFVGSIGFMTDIIEIQSSHFVDSQRMAETLTQLADELELKIGWEERVAARLCLVGLALLSAEERAKLLALDLSDPQHEVMLAKLCQMSARMIEHIPRLGRIAKILRHVPKVDGWLSVSQPEDFISATLLRISLYWCMLTHKGLPANSTIQEIKLIMPKITESMNAALQNLNDFADCRVAAYIPVHELQEGMVVFDDIVSEQGAIIVSRGRRLTIPIIEKLERHYGSATAKVKVVEGSCHAAMAAAV